MSQLDSPTVIGRKELVTAATEDSFHTPFMKSIMPFVNGGLSGMVATTIIQPVDMIKVRLQSSGEGMATGPKPTAVSVTRDLLAQGKISSLYTGVSAALTRQAVYTTARIGFYDTFTQALSKRASDNGSKVGFAERAIAGLSAGGIAAFVGNPADLALIRMQTDGMKPIEQRKNYRSVVHALMSISKGEGITALWAGATPTVVRAMALNLGQLAVFSEAKAHLKKHTNWSAQAQVLCASAVAGFFASFLSLPFDFVKTRLQKQQKGFDGRLQYRGLADCFFKVYKQEGFVFYRGFGTYYVRIAPHA